MPRRTTTRTQNRTHTITDERRFTEALIHAEAEQRARDREQSHEPGTDWGSA